MHAPTTTLHDHIPPYNHIPPYDYIPPYNYIHRYVIAQSTGGIEYLPGGIESGFHHVVRDDFPTRLLQLKGQTAVPAACAACAVIVTSLCRHCDVIVMSS